MECTLAKLSYKKSLKILVCHNLLKYYQNKSDKTDNDTALSYDANKTSKWEATQQTNLPCFKFTQAHNRELQPQ
jgi:hypothetical protein